jgi:GNAT superfamily N-acetyltransferase
MGYALGRLEEIAPHRASFGFLKYDQPPEYIGHLASLALHERFRGQGVAQALMQRLHSNLAEYYEMDRVNLFFRVRMFLPVALCPSYETFPLLLMALIPIQTSNSAALKLYGSRLLYERDRTVTRYYLDGEDAHLMLCAGLRARWQALSEQERAAVRAANALPPAPICSLSAMPNDTVGTIGVADKEAVDRERPGERLGGGGKDGTGSRQLLQ